MTDEFESFNVKDYVAPGDTDDAIAIQRAINAAELAERDRTIATLREELGDMRGLNACCFYRLFSLPLGWRGRTTYCPCGNLLVLRDGEWQSADVWHEIDADAAERWDCGCVFGDEHGPDCALADATEQAE